jgi:hypothetical protein
MEDIDIYEETRIHLNCEKILELTNGSLLTQSKKYENMLNILTIMKDQPYKILILCQYKDLCMQILDENKIFYSQRRKMLNISINKKIFVELIKKEKINQNCFPILKKYPLEKKTKIYEKHISYNNNNYIFVLEVDYNTNSIYDMYILAKNNNIINNDIINKLCKLIFDKNITKDKKYNT